MSTTVTILVVIAAAAAAAAAWSMYCWADWLGHRSTRRRDAQRSVNEQVTFNDPDFGAVRVELGTFQLDDTGAPGVHTYVLDNDGNRVRGVVVRWDNGPDVAPMIVHWRRPHCPDDQCGSPCGHDDDPDEAAYEAEEAQALRDEHDQYHRDGMCPCPAAGGDD